MLRWRWFLGYSSIVVATIFAWKGGQSFDHGLMLPHSPLEFPRCKAKNRLLSVEADF